VRFAVPHYGIEENVSATPTATNYADYTASPVSQLPASASPEQHVLDSTSDGESLSAAPVLMTPVSKCGSVGFSLGTPIEAAGDAEADGSTPYAGAVKSLPDRSLFAVGVSDHILYENLPNATGTFQRLREVIRSLHSSSSPASTSSPH